MKILLTSVPERTFRCIIEANKAIMGSMSMAAVDYLREY